MNKSAERATAKSSAFNFFIFLAFFLGVACVIAFVTGGMGTVSSGAPPPSTTHQLSAAER